MGRASSYPSPVPFNSDKAFLLISISESRYYFKAVITLEAWQGIIGGGLGDEHEQVAYVYARRIRDSQWHEPCKWWSDGKLRINFFQRGELLTALARRVKSRLNRDMRKFAPKGYRQTWPSHETLLSENPRN